MTGTLSPLRRAIIGICSLASLWPNVAAADGATLLPDPASITAPDIGTNDPNVLAKGYKFFVFYNSAVDFATAYADISQCRSFLPAGLGRALPGFIPWVAAQPPATPTYTPSRLGLIGDLMVTAIEPKVDRGRNNTILHRCMETRGYVRYPVSEAVWNALNDPKNAQLVAMQAKIAAGAKPPQPEVTDQ
jgi:hypothetical protein